MILIYFILLSRSRGVRKVADPILVFLPFWRAKGYHECFYFRGKTYRVSVPDDVVAVQAGERMRTLTSEIKTRPSLLLKIIGVIRRIFLARPEHRYFVVDNTTELAHQSAEASVIVDGNGKEDLATEYLLEKKPKMHQLEGPRTEEPGFKFAPSAFTAEDVVHLLHSKVVRPPAVFSRILSNRFEVTELQLLGLPIYVFRYAYLGRQKELRIHGVTGESLRYRPKG